MAPIRSMVRIALSRLVVALGLSVGFFALVRCGMVNPADRFPGSLMYQLTSAGVGLFVLAFLYGSSVAPGNRRHAGMFFLAVMPFADFCLAYPMFSSLVSEANGGDWFETHLSFAALGLTVLLFVPLLAPWLARRHRKHAAYLFAISALFAGLAFSMFRWTTVLLPLLAEASSPFLLFGLFWLGTHKLRWPPLVQPRPRAMIRRIAAFVIKCAVVMCLDLVITLGFSALYSSLYSGDCGGKPLFVHPLAPNHAVFTARIIFVGRSIEALTRDSGINPGGVNDRRVGEWAIGLVQERFWGLPSWTPRLVLLTDFIYWKGETYFIDGRQADGLFRHLLPIVEAGIGCSRTRLEGEAIVELRVLREAPSRSGARLIGYVRQPEVFVGGFVPPASPHPAVGAKISVTGPTGTIIIATDQWGVYQLDDLPQGDYVIKLLVPGSRMDFLQHESSVTKVHVNGTGLVEENFVR